MSLTSSQNLGISGSLQMLGGHLHWEAFLDAPRRPHFCAPCPLCSPMEGPPPLTVNSWQEGLGHHVSALWPLCLRVGEMNVGHADRKAGGAGLLPQGPFFLLCLHTPGTQANHPAPYPSSQDSSHQGPHFMCPALTCSPIFPCSTGCGKAISSLCRTHATSLQVEESVLCPGGKGRGETEAKVNSFTRQKTSLPKGRACQEPEPRFPA